MVANQELKIFCILKIEAFIKILMRRSPAVRPHTLFCCCFLIMTLTRLANTSLNRASDHPSSTSSWSFYKKK